MNTRRVGHVLRQQIRRVLDGEQIEEAPQRVSGIMKASVLEVVLHFNHPAALAERSERVRNYPIALHAPMPDLFFSFLSHYPPKNFLRCAFRRRTVSFRIIWGTQRKTQAFLSLRISFMAAGGTKSLESRL
jgi:hypothetical protein